jgi:hypothetical protein
VDARTAEVLRDFQRFKDLTFEDFRGLARTEGMSRYQRIGFPDAYRAGHEAHIFADIRAKLPLLDERGKVVLDVGPGCSDLPHMLIDHCHERGHTLLLSDSAEMLVHLPDGPAVRKCCGCFPRDCPDLLAEYAGRVDVILVYSVLHYVFVQQPLFEFLDAALELLAEGGQMLIGDVPNVGKRKRFFRSAAGVRHHQAFTGTAEVPEVAFNCLEPGKIDDGTMFALLMHCRAAGFDAYVVPQAAGLPMANRREDILIHRP